LVSRTQFCFRSPRTSKLPSPIRPRSRFKARTRKSSVRSRRTFGAIIRPSLTRAKAFVTPANKAGVRKAKRSNNFMATFNRKAARERLHRRIRKKVSGTAARPRLSIYFSGKHVYAQVIDDDVGKTLIAASTAEKDVLGKHKAAANRASAEVVGKVIAERARGKKIENVVFDRGGFQYQGKVKALADAAREGGLKF